MSIVPTIATAVPAPDPDRMPGRDRVPPSGGWAGAATAVLLALGRSLFGRGAQPSTTMAATLVTPDVDDEASATLRTVGDIGPVRDIALSPDGNHAYVAEASAVTIVDTRDNAVIKSVEGLADVVPASLAASPDSTRLYVADRNAATIHVVDVAKTSHTRNHVVDTLRLDGSLPVGYGAPTSITLSPNGSRLYAQMADPAVLIVDPTTRMLAGAVSGGDSIAMFAAGERIYVCADDRLGHTNVTAGVVILEADTGDEVGSFGLNDAPAFIRQPILAGGNGQLYLDIDDLDGCLEVVDTSTLNVVARIKIDASAAGTLRSIPAGAVMSPDGRRLYVANQGVRLIADEATEVGWISVVDTRQNEVIDDIALPDPGIDGYRSASPQFIAIGPAGDRLVVVNEYGVASVIDITTKDVVDTITLGEPTDQPRVVTVNPARNSVYVGGDAGLTVIAL